MKVYVFRIASVILLIAMMVSIFALSAQTATESSGLSEGFSYKVFSLFYPGFKDLTKAEQSEILNNSSFSVRKLAHFSLYFLLGVFSFLTFVTYKSLRFYLRTVISFAFCVLYASSDEIHQYFVPGRSCELRDVLIDSSGALLSIVCLILFCLVFKRIKKLVL